LIFEFESSLKILDFTFCKSENFLLLAGNFFFWFFFEEVLSFSSSPDGNENPFLPAPRQKRLQWTAGRNFSEKELFLLLLKKGITNN